MMSSKAKSPIKRYLVNVALAMTAIVLCLILGEGLARLLLNPGDYLAPALLTDEALERKIKPHSAGHDAWGFRNDAVPSKADIVVIGDSQSYGVNAFAGDSWPAVLKKLTEKEVYNMSQGGYGTVQYYYLLKNQAIILQPELVVVGLYLGNDLIETYYMVHDHEYWKSLRKSGISATDVDFVQKEPVVAEPIDKPFFLGSLRFWLSEHSIIYRLLIHAFEEQMRLLEMKYHLGHDTIISVLDDSDNNLYTGFTPARRLLAVDLTDPRVREGFEITLDLLKEMNEFCAERGITFVVMLIPSKESVYSRYIEDNDNLEYSELIDRIIACEREVNGLLKYYFADNNILFLDLLEPLQSALGQMRIYPKNQDDHMNKSGYEIIARVFQKFLEEKNLCGE